MMVVTVMAVLLQQLLQLLVAVMLFFQQLQHKTGTVLVLQVQQLSTSVLMVQLILKVILVHGVSLAVSLY